MSQKSPKLKKLNTQNNPKWPKTQINPTPKLWVKTPKKSELEIFRFGLALNMVGALVYMHSRYTAARMVEEEKDLESTNATV